MKEIVPYLPSFEEEHPLLEDELITQVVSALTPEHALSQYIEVINDNHRQGIAITLLEVLKTIPPTAISYWIGILATLGYLKVSQEAAQGNIVNYYLNPAGAVVLNALVNGYFFNLVISAKWNSLLTRKPDEVQVAIDELKNLSPGLIAKILRGLGQTATFMLILFPSLLSAYPFYILSKSVSRDPELTADIVLLSATMLQYNGVEAMVFKWGPALFYPIKALYRQFNSTAMDNHKIRTTISLLKNAHKGALESARRKILQLVQTRDDHALNDIYALLTKKNPNKNESIKLLMELLKFAQTKEYQASPVGRVFFQIISLVLTVASLPGYFLVTKEGAADFAKLNDAFQEWLLGSAIFLISIALSLDIGWVVGGDLYDLMAYAANGIKEAWRASTGVFDFMKKAWQHKSNLGSWYNLVKLPLSIQQNLKIMLSLLGFIYALSYWSTQTSTFLNEEKLGKEVSKYLELATVISVMLFNCFPVDKVLGSAQRFWARIIGTERSKQEIELEQLLQNQTDMVGEINDFKFLSILNDIVTSDKLEEAEVESVLTTFFGNKDPKLIFGEHKYSERKFSQIVPKLLDKKIHDLSIVGFFSSRPHDQQSLLFNDEEYEIKLKEYPNYQAINNEQRSLKM